MVTQQFFHETSVSFTAQERHMCGYNQDGMSNSKSVNSLTVRSLTFQPKWHPFDVTHVSHYAQKYLDRILEEAAMQYHPRHIKYLVETHQWCLCLSPGIATSQAYTLASKNTSQENVQLAQSRNTHSKSIAKSEGTQYQTLLNCPNTNIS